MAIIVNCLISEIPEHTYNLVLFKAISHSGTGNIIPILWMKKTKVWEGRDLPGTLHQGNSRARNRYMFPYCPSCSFYCNLKNKHIPLSLALSRVTLQFPESSVLRIMLNSRDFSHGRFLYTSFLLTANRDSLTIWWKGRLVPGRWRGQGVWKEMLKLSQRSYQESTVGPI